MTPRPTILFVSPKIGQGFRDGSSIRQLHLLQAYRRIGCVIFVAFCRGEEDLIEGERLRQYCDRIELVPIVNSVDVPVGPWRERAKVWLTPRPAMAQALFSSAMKGVVERLVPTADLVHVSRLWMIPNIEALIRRRGSRPSWVLDLDDVESTTRRRSLQFDRSMSWRRRLFERYDLGRLARYESRAIASFDRIFVCSETDQQRLDRANVVVIPNGAKVPPQTLPEAGDGRTILYLGLLSYEPNIDGLHFFVRQILPKIRQQIPDARLLVVGRTPTAEVRALHDGETIVVCGDVPEVESYYRAATISVVALRYAGGTRLRILEAFALGRAVVSTKIGCEGLGVVDGEHLLIADEADHFARQCVRALRDPDLRSHLTGNGRKLVEERYTWSSIEDRLAALTTGLVDPGPIHRTTIPS